MKALLKTVATLIVILLLHVGKLLLSKNSNAYTFYFNFLSCLQLLFLSWCAFTLLVDDLLLGSIVKRKSKLIGTVTFLVLVCIAEGGCTFLLDHPSKVPLTFYSAFKEYYDLFDCKDIQFDSRFSEYNQKLFYELKSNNAFRFSNREFADSFYTNRASLRDNDASLTGPEIICVGDSYTLGWGDNEHDNYPAIIQNKTGLKVLNVSMSSYGTAREMMKLESMDLSHVQYIFWQYCSNDQEENSVYLSNGFSLPIHPSQGFDSVVQLHNWTRKYFPGKNFFTISKLWFREKLLHKKYVVESSGSHMDREDQEKKAKDFLAIISRSSINFSKTRVVVFELGPYPIYNGFTKKLEQLSQQQPFSAGWKGNFLVFDASSVFGKSDYYTLDVHLKKSGNEKLVDALLRAFPIH